YFTKSNPQNHGIKAYLKLVQERQTSNPDYGQLLVLLSQLHTYIATTETNNLRSNTLREWFVAAMEEANRMEAVIEVDQPVRDADLAFRAEMLTLLGQQRIREEEAEEAKANGEAKAKNKNRLMAAAAGGALVAVGAFAAGPAAAVGALNLIGFSSVGPVAGSLAAIAQSIVYGGAVGSGSLFAIFQSAAMGGIAVGSPAQIAAGVAALGTGARLLGGVRRSKKHDDGTASSNSGDSSRTN
ncbi:hypothetical protein FS837_007057, partial [Tulasnella sp. UAMH 9824]